MKKAFTCMCPRRQSSPSRCWRAVPGRVNPPDRRMPDRKRKQDSQKSTLNEVAHSIFYAPMYAAVEEGILPRRELTWILCVDLEIT